MSGKTLKQQVKDMDIDPKSRYSFLRQLIVEGFFDSPIPSKGVVHRIKEKFGRKWKTSHVQTYMRKFMMAGIIHAVKPYGNPNNFWVLASVSRPDALSLIGKTAKIQELEHELFSTDLTKRLKKDFEQELQELHENFGRNGNCTAFLLRKTLEKLIIITFGKMGRNALLEDKARPGGWKGLQEMIEIAAREKVNGIPFLIPKTANEIKGLKFLGDTAAHNPLVSVKMKTILPEMAYIITAYEELARRL
jgi:hypothetical protein